jgi:hypothetical protein
MRGYTIVAMNPERPFRSAASSARDGSDAGRVT